MGKFNGADKRYNPTELPLSEMQESSCDCVVCRDMCRRTPCWPTPQEAEHLLDVGYVSQLDLAYYQGYNAETQRFLPAVWAVVPKLRGTEMHPQGCIFQIKGLCELHGKHKPLEGRLAHHSGTPRNLREQMAMLWNTPEGRRVIERFNRMESRRNPDGPNPDFLNPNYPSWEIRLQFWGPLASTDDGRGGVWKHSMDWDSPMWRRVLAERIGNLLKQYGFVVCPRCGTEHTGLTMCCRNCNHCNRSN